LRDAVAARWQAEEELRQLYRQRALERARLALPDGTRLH
jgi:hypothetical protein